MDRQKIKQHITDFSSELEQTIYEPIVYRDVRQVPIDIAKVFFLLLPMLNEEHWDERIKTAAIAIGAVHAAFDVHDTINPSNATSKQQQLTVLSGDYYSGIHYQLLASIPELGFIQSLSRSIGHINEVKTILHYKIPDEPEQLIEAIRIVEAGCIKDFLHTFGFSKYETLANIVLPLLRLQSGRLSGNAMGIETAITLLSAELQNILQASDFLAPILHEEIRNMTQLNFSNNR